jgi:hypothetical protein
MPPTTMSSPPGLPVTGAPLGRILWAAAAFLFGGVSLLLALASRRNRTGPVTTN